jgi:DNA-binding transcriptional ArsR family regulator
MFEVFINFLFTKNFYEGLLFIIVRWCGVPGSDLLDAVLNRERIRIIRLLVKKKMYPLQISKKLNLSHSDVAYHLSVLHDAGIVKREVGRTGEGRLAYFYDIDRPRLRHVLHELQAIVNGILDELGE